MSWNYRVVRKRFTDGHEEFGIYSVYYDEKVEVRGMSVEPAAVNSYSLAELSRELDLMKEALQKPVLEHSKGEVARDESHDCLISVGNDSAPDEASIKRLFGILLELAIRDRARKIQLQPRSKRGGFKVFHLLQETDEWQEQMNLHRDESKPLRAYLETVAGEDGAFSIALHSAEHGISIAYEFKLRAEDSTYGETLILTIPPALLPDV